MNNIELADLGFIKDVPKALHTANKKVEDLSILNNELDRGIKTLKIGLFIAIGAGILFLVLYLNCTKLGSPLSFLKSNKNDDENSNPQLKL